MGIARAFSRVLRSHVNIHPAWLPITSSVALGDYGLWRKGVFTPVGNIREFGVKIESAAGQSIRLDFMSSKVRATKFCANMPVAAFPAGVAQAELRFEMAAAESFVLKAARLTSTRVTNVGPITRALAMSRRQRGPGRWRLRYKIVSELYVGTDVLVLASVSKQTTVSLRGSAHALRSAQQGRAPGGLDVSSNKQLGLQIVGGHGPVGLGLFRVRASGIPMVNFGEGELPAGSYLDTDGNLFEPEPVAWTEEPRDDPDDDG